MLELKHQTSCATLIGDVVGSRAASDRPALHRRLSALLARANDELRPLVALRITVGDEFQGCFTTVGDALHAALWLRLELLPGADLRHGVGWGPVSVLREEPRVEDGPGWWAARAAIESVKADAKKSSLRQLRTSYRRADGVGGPDPGPVNAALLCRDHMVGSVVMKTSGRPLRLLRGSLAGRSQTQLADDEGVSASAVSQQVRHNGIAVILEADRLLREVS